MARASATLVALSLLLLQGCGNLQRISEIGVPPSLSPIVDPTQNPEWRPISMPGPFGQPVYSTANSLWRPGSRAFFKDQRAAQVGDLITVAVNIVDSAVLKNTTSAVRNGTQDLAAAGLFGLESGLRRTLPRGTDLSALLQTDSQGKAVGNGNINRGEVVQLTLAGVVTQVLPNGNLAVVGKQEVRVNSELRELLITGIVRPQDIAADNTVQHDRMAEARISYGGRGQITDVQTPRYGQQLIDLISPF